MKLFPGGRRFWRAASGAKQHVSLDGKKSSSRTCILIQERTRKENPGGKRQREGEEEGEGEEKERDQWQLLGRSFADNCSVIHQLIGHLNAPSKAHSRPIQGRPCEAAKLGRRKPKSVGRSFDSFNY
jgi:hypothetical protein